MKGRKPVPKEIAKIRGYYRPGKHKDQLSLSGLDFIHNEVPEPPEELNKYAKEIWNYQLEEAAKVFGYISQLDLPLFKMYCEVYGDLLELQDLCKKETYTYKDKSGATRVNPIFKERDNIEKMFLKLSTEFGFSPSARTRIKLQDSQPKDDEDDYIL